MYRFRWHLAARTAGKLLGLTLALGLGLLAIRQYPVSAQEQNLLVNPSFEGPYSAYNPGAPIPDCPAGVCATAQTAAGWTPWWQPVTGFLDAAIYGNPEYKPAEASDFANRVRSGERAQQYFNFGRTSTAGLLQRVAVPANSGVRFTVWGQAWSTGIGWDCPLCDVTYSGEPTPVNMRIGIDPTGGQDPFSPNIVWSGTANPYDQYALFSVEAVAQTDAVTVFTYSSPSEPRKHNDIYWDDASLVLTSGGAPAPVTTSGDGEVAAAPVFFELQPTPTPDADGVIYAQVPPGGSLWSVAANAGISLDELLDNNDLSRNDFVQVGQFLVIGYGEPAGEEAGEDAEVTAGETLTDTVALEGEAASPAESGGDSSEAAEAVALATVETTPEPPAAEPAAEEPAIAVSDAKLAGGSICLKAFDDANENSLHDPGEALRANVAFTVANGQKVISNYVTTGRDEPYCIAGLSAGNYQVTRSQQEDEVLTTRGDWGIALGDGSVVTMEFGSVIDATAVAAAGAAAGADESAAEVAAPTNAATGEGANTSSIITIAAVILAGLLLVVVVGLVVTARRTA